MIAEILYFVSGKEVSLQTCRRAHADFHIIFISLFLIKIKITIRKSTYISNTIVSTTFEQIGRRFFSSLTNSSF